MTTLALTLTDSATMLRRNLKRAVRYPGLTVIVAAMPIVFLLLFVFVFGGTLGAGLGAPSGGRAEYLAYVVPGILILAITGGAQGTAIGIAMDMTEGIIARFRTMSIARAAVLTGHVVGAVIQTMVGLALVVAVALLVGFRPDATPLEWLAVIGVLAMTSFALSWASGASMASGSDCPRASLRRISSRMWPRPTRQRSARWPILVRSWWRSTGRRRRWRGQLRP